MRISSYQSFETEFAKQMLIQKIKPPFGDKNRIDVAKFYGYDNLLAIASRYLAVSGLRFDFTCQPNFWDPFKRKGFFSAMAKNILKLNS